MWYNLRLFWIPCDVRLILNYHKIISFNLIRIQSRITMYSICILSGSVARYIVFKGLFTLAIFSSEKRAIFFLLWLVLVFCIVPFRLAIFQWFSQVRTKITCKQMGAVPIQVRDVCKQTYKINIKIAWKNSQCEYVKIYRFWTQKIARLRKSPMWASRNASDHHISNLTISLL